MVKRLSMSATLCGPGGFDTKKGTELVSVRKRVTGILSEGSRGMLLRTGPDELWVLETQAVECDPALIGQSIIAEGMVAGIDRLRVDWIGIAPA